MIIGQIITMAIMYTWAQCNKDVVVSFYFGTKFPAMYLPWALLMFNILLGGNGMTELMGIVTGHVYFFFKFAYPRDLGGTAWLETPAFLKSYFPEEGAGRAGLNGAFGEAPASRQQNAPPPRTAWGRGRTLGDNWSARKWSGGGGAFCCRVGEMGNFLCFLFLKLKCLSGMSAGWNLVLLLYTPIELRRRRAFARQNLKKGTFSGSGHLIWTLPRLPVYPEIAEIVWDRMMKAAWMLCAWFISLSLPQSLTSFPSLLFRKTDTAP